MKFTTRMRGNFASVLFFLCSFFFVLFVGLISSVVLFVFCAVVCSCACVCCACVYFPLGLARSVSPSPCRFSFHVGLLCFFRLFCTHISFRSDRNSNKKHSVIPAPVLRCGPTMER